MYTKRIQTVNNMQIEFNNQGYIQGSKPEYKKKVNQRDKFIPKLPEAVVTKPKRKTYWNGFEEYIKECKRTELLTK